MTKRIDETKAALVRHVAADRTLVRLSVPGFAPDVARAAVDAVFDELGIKELRGEAIVPDEVAEKNRDKVRERLHAEMSHKVTLAAPLEVTEKPQTVYDFGRAVRRFQSSALIITKEPGQ